MIKMHVLSIDIGLVNFAFVLVRVSRDCDEIYEVIDCARFDLRTLKCTGEKCVLHGQKTHSHYTIHLFEKFKSHFEKSDVILIERQPPGGFGSIEQLIQRNFPEKVKLMEPRSLHKFLGISNLNYEERKEAVLKIGEPYLSHLAKFNRENRKHDMADALMYVIKYTSDKHQAIQDEKISKNNVFKNYIYVPPKKCPKGK